MPVAPTERFKMIAEVWRKEFTYRSLTLKFSTPTDFYTSQWQKSNRANKFYLMYRWMVSLIFLVTLILSVIDLNDPGQSAIQRLKWLIYLTHWGYMVCWLQSFLAAYLVTTVYIKQKKIDYVPEKHINPHLCNTYWVAFSISTVAALAITSIYWTLIYDSKTDKLDAMNFFVHAINSVMMLMDLTLVRHPVRLLHVYWPFIFAVIYVVFNLFYYLAGGTDKEGKPYVYSILNWSNPGRSTLVSFLALMFLVFLHFLVYCMYLLRRKLHSSCCEKNSARVNGSLSIALTDTREENGKKLSMDGGVIEHF